MDSGVPIKEQEPDQTRLFAVMQESYPINWRVPRFTRYWKKQVKENENRWNRAKTEEKQRLLIVDIFMHPDQNRWKPLNSKIIFFNPFYRLFTECYRLFTNQTRLFRRLSLVNNLMPGNSFPRFIPFDIVYALRVKGTLNMKGKSKWANSISLYWGQHDDNLGRSKRQDQGRPAE